MGFANAGNRRFYAGCLMVALLLLQVALASISPYKLSSDISKAGVNSYIRAMDLTSGNSLANVDQGRMRLRAHSYWTLCSILKVVTERLDVFSFLDFARCHFDNWNKLIGYELSAAPHADMVARK